MEKPKNLYVRPIDKLRLGDAGGRGDAGQRAMKERKKMGQL